MLMRRTLEDTILRTLWTIGVSTLFSRMALELIHDTLTHLTVPLIFWEMALPVVGVLVAELAPEKTEDFIQVRIARLPPPHSHPHWLGACSGLTSRDRHSSLLLKLRTFWTNDTPCPRRESMLTLRLVRSWQRSWIRESLGLCLSCFPRRWSSLSSFISIDSTCRLLASFSC